MLWIGNEEIFYATVAREWPPKLHRNGADANPDADPELEEDEPEEEEGTDEEPEED
jgi:hypothetical protein